MPTRTSFIQPVTRGTEPAIIDSRASARITAFDDPVAYIDVDLDNPQKILGAIKTQATEPAEWWDHTMNSNVEYLFTRFVEKKMRGWQVLKDRRLNILELIADSTVDRIHMAGWRLGDGLKVPQTFQKQIKDLDNQTGLSKFSRDLFLRAEIQGLTFLLIWPTRNGDVGVIRATPATTIVGYADDGSSVWPEWAARVSNKDRQIDVMYTDRYDRWERPDGSIGAAWTKTIDGQQYPDYWMDAVPVVPFASVSFLHPRSGIKAAFGCQKAIDHCMGIDTISIELSAFPVRYTAQKTNMDQPAEAELARGLQFDGEFDNEVGIEEPPIDVYPGAILDLSADMVGQFEPADTSATVGRIEAYAKMGNFIF